MVGNPEVIRDLVLQTGLVPPFQMVLNRMDGCTTSIAAVAPELWIRCLEVHDSIFEFVFPERLGHDGSGEKGFETLDQRFLSSMSKGNAPAFPTEVNLH
jgi:hypothetical protein